MPVSLVLLWFFLLGAIIGSFLNVVIYRLHTGRSFGGRSHCLSCGEVLKPSHLVPVFSYLVLRGRCAYCASRISPQYVSVELLTGALFVFTAHMVSNLYVLPLYLALISVLVLIVVYDLRHTVIPDEGVLAASGAVLLIALVGIGIGEETVSSLLYRLLGAASGFLFFGGLWYVSNGRWVGFGDAKLVIPLGFLVSWPHSISALVLSFWIGAGLSLMFLAIEQLAKRGQARLRFIPRSLTMKSEIPFAPFLILGFLLTHFYAFNAFALPYHLLF